MSAPDREYTIEPTLLFGYEPMGYQTELNASALEAKAMLAVNTVAIISRLNMIALGGKD